MVRTDKADKAKESELEKATAALPKKKRIMYMLLSAYQRGLKGEKNDWLTVTDLKNYASRGHIYNIIAEFRDRGWIQERQLIRKGRRTTGWKGTEQLASFISSQEEGQLPRATEFGQIPKTRALAKRLRKAGKPKKPKYEQQTVKVITQPTKPLSDYLGVDNAYTENIRVTLILDPTIAAMLRAKMNPPGKSDRAKQYTLNLENLTITISNRDKCVLVLKTKAWGDELSSLCVLCQIPTHHIKSLIQEINLSMPDGFARVEFPVFMQQLNDLEVSYEMTTRILDDEGNPTGFIIESNINRSMLVDFEMLGKVYAVDSFLSAISALQHSVSVAYANMEIQKKKESEAKMKSLQEREAELLFCGCEETSPVLIVDKYICSHCGKQVPQDRAETHREEKKEKSDDWKNNYC